MFLFETEIKNQIGFSIRMMNTVLMEKLGYPEEVFEFSKRFSNIVVRQIKETSYGSPTSFTYSENDMDSGIPFVRKFSIKVEMFLEKGESGSEGGLDDFRTEVYFDGGNMCMSPVIHVSCHGECRAELQNELFASIGHEMTHAYSCYRILMSNMDKVSELAETPSKLSYVLIALGTKTETEYYGNVSVLVNPRGSFDMIFSAVKYITSEPERRAQISELRHELESVRETITDSESASKAITGSKVYRSNFLKLNRELDILVSSVLEDERHVLDVPVIKSFKKVFKKNYNDVGKIIIYLEKLKNEYYRFFVNKSCKVVQDIIDRNTAMSGKFSRKIPDVGADLDEIMKLEK